MRDWLVLAVLIIGGVIVTVALVLVGERRRDRKIGEPEEGWVVRHGLNELDPVVSCYEVETGKLLKPPQVTPLDEMNLHLCADYEQPFRVAVLNAQAVIHREVIIPRQEKP